MVSKDGPRIAVLTIAIMGMLTVFTSLGPPSLANGSFVDDDGSIHEAYIEAVAAAGITKGCNPPANDRFCPNQTVSRGAMAAFLRRALSLPPASRDYFEDDASSIFEDDINAVAAAGITRGCNPPSNTRFCPDGAVTRGQLAAFLVRGFGYDTIDSDMFRDDDGSVFESAINALGAAGITAGCNPPTNDRFCPDAAVRRDQMASFLARALSLVPIPPTPDDLTTTYSLSDVAWSSSTNGFGPVERNASNGEDAANDGASIRIAGQSFAKGIGVHAESVVTVDLHKSCFDLTVTVGVDDEVGGAGSVVFEIWTDNLRAFRSGIITGHSPPQAIAVDLKGIDQLRLVATDGGDGKHSDHADWADAQVTCVASSLTAIGDSDGSAPPPPPPPNSGEDNSTVGPRPLGDVQYDVEIHPGDNIQDAVNANPPGTVFLIRAGVHRQQWIKTIKDGDQFIGEYGAVLSGAKRLTNFVQEGNHWYAPSQTQQGDVTGYCADGHPGCKYPEDVFVNDVMLEQVIDLEDLGPGKWFFDYSADRIYLNENPTGRKVETSVTLMAFSGDAKNVVIRNLVIEKYANGFDNGVVGLGSRDWTVEDNDVRLNHAGGIHLSDGMAARRNLVRLNGQIGILGGNGAGITVADNEIADNNLARFDVNHSGGGTKFARVSNLIVKGNSVHDNLGPGLWADGSNTNVLYEDNLVEGNAGFGIFHEISFDAVIRGNIVRDNGKHGIWISASTGVEVVNNQVLDNAEGGIAGNQDPRGDHELRNLWVHANFIRQTVPSSNDYFGWTGIQQQISSDAPFTVWNNRFEDNVYEVSASQAGPFKWDNRRVPFNEWQAYGNDVDGRVSFLP